MIAAETLSVLTAIATSSGGGSGSGGGFGRHARKGNFIRLRFHWTRNPIRCNLIFMQNIQDYLPGFEPNEDDLVLEKRCSVVNSASERCDRLVGKHGAQEMCPGHYQRLKTKWGIEPDRPLGVRAVGRSGPAETLTVTPGQRFGKGVVIGANERIRKGTGTRRAARLMCDCGNEYIAIVSDVINGRKVSCGCLKGVVQTEQGVGRVVNRTGRKYGRLTAIQYVGNEEGYKGGALWLCRCDCGNEATVSSGALMSKNKASCGCLKRKPRVTQTARNTVLSHYRSSARRRGHVWELDDYFDKLTSMNCHYCGRSPGNIQKVYRVYEPAGREFAYNGIDRVDNKLGYTIDNVVTACSICNNAKKAMSYNDFTAWIKDLVTYSASRNQSGIDLSESLPQPGDRHSE